MLTAPWVSCVIPFHNDAATLERAVDSVLDQGVPVEIILIDDASQDASLAVAQTLARSDAGITLCRNTENLGAAASRNIAARRASGDLLCFLDADDQHLPGFYALACLLLDEHEEWAAIKGGLEFADVPDSYGYDSTDPRHANVEFSCPGNLVVRREVFDALNGFPVDAAFRRRGGGEDVAFMTALTRFFVYFQSVQKVYRAHDKPGSHLRTFLERTRVVDSRVEWLQSLAEEDDGSMQAAYDRYVATVDISRLGTLACARPLNSVSRQRVAKP